VSNRKSQLKVAALSAKSILLFLYICWFVWRREASLQDLQLLLAIPFAIAVGLEVAAQPRKSANSAVFDKNGLKEQCSELSNTLNPTQVEEASSEANASAWSNGWKDFLLNLGVLGIVVILVCVAGLPALAMYLYGVTHPDYANKYLLPANKILASNWLGFVEFTLVGLGLITNDAYLIVEAKLPRLGQTLKWSSRLIFGVGFGLWTVSQCFRFSI
jgi:hypothetical protein